MQAYKFERKVPPSHCVTVELPPDAPTGLAHIIVLFPDTAQEIASPPTAAPSTNDLDALFAYLDQLPPSTRSKDEIDRYVTQERASWD